jgi:RHS repeat-associated protein
VDSSGTATYKRDGADVTDPVLSDGSALYTPGVSERRGSTTKFDHQDYLGTFTRQTNSSQTTTATRQYDAFGLLVASTGTPQGPFGFVGRGGYQEYPDSALKLLGHRYYDPSTGRFLTRDPAKDGRNWYDYCENEPDGCTDPEGYQVALDSVNANERTAMELVREGDAPKGVVQAVKRMVVQWGERRGIPLSQHAALRAVQRLDKLEDLLRLYRGGGGYWDTARQQYVIWSKVLGRFAVIDPKTGTIITIIESAAKKQDWIPVGRGFLH